MWKKIKNGAKKVGKAVFGAVKTVVNVVAEAVAIVVSAIAALVVEPIARLFGSAPMKKIRIKVVVLRDEHGPLVDPPAPKPDDVFLEDRVPGHAVATRPSVIHLNAMLIRAREILEQRARVTFKPTMPEIEWRDDVAPDAALDPRCPGQDGHWGPFWDHLSGEAGDYLSGIAGRFYSIPRVLTVFITRDGPGEGCSIGPITNYATIDHDEFHDQEEGGRLLAHELGHACNLFHRRATENLMFRKMSRGTRLTRWQRFVVRTSGRVTYW
jgi:hypothetical protein